MNRFCHDVHLPQPFNIKVGCVDPKTSLEKVKQASCFLPHMRFSSLVGSYHHIFDETFGKGKDLEKFWSGVEQSGDDKLTGHPVCLEKHWKEKTIPLFIHGDGVVFQNRDTILVFSWYCGQAPHIHPFVVEFKVPQPKGTMVLQGAGLCWACEQDGSQCELWCERHQTHTKDGQSTGSCCISFGKGRCNQTLIWAWKTQSE